MKKNVALLLIALTMMFILASCDDKTKHDHSYSVEWSYNEENHYHSATCGHDEKKDIEQHQFGEWESKLEADKEIKSRECTICHFKQIEEISLIDHQCNYGKWSILEEPTISKTGRMMRVCKEYSSHTEIKELPILNEKDYSYYVIKEASCSEKGRVSYSFDAEIVFYVDLEKLDHTYSDSWSSDKNSHFHQANCEHTDEKKDVEAHEFNKWEIIQDPTKETEGKKTRKCKICKFEEQVILPKLNKTDYVYTLIKEPTCLENGLERYVYQGEETFDCVIEKKGHSFSTQYKFDEQYHYYPATCEHTDEKKGLEKHEFTKWETVFAATEEKDGLEKRSCLVCEYEEERSIPKLSHTHEWEEWKVTKNPTFALEGILSRVCLKDSSHIEKISLPVLNKSDYTYTLIKESTCLEDGKCCYTYENKYPIYVVLEHTGHTYSEELSFDDSHHYYPATCEHSNEKKDMESHTLVKNICSVCGYIHSTVGLDYLLNEDGTGYIVTGIGEATDIDIVIPAAYENLPVVKIDEQAFTDVTTIQSIRFLSENMIIGGYAFWGCTNLEYVYLSNTIVTIETGSFYECKKIIAVENAKNIVSVGDYAFYSCSSLSSLDISGMVSVGVGAFWNCSSLQEAILNDTITELPNYLFYNCSNLKKIVFPKSVVSVGSSILNNVENIEEISLPISLLAEDFYLNNCKKIILLDGESLPDYKFSNFTHLQSVVLPDTLISIGESTFEYCTSLNDIVLPTSLESIGDYAFADCSNIISITIPASVTSIGNSTFNNCYRLLEVYNLSSIDCSNLFSNVKVIHTSLEDESHILKTEEGFYFYKDSSELLLFAYDGQESNITLPEKYMDSYYTIYDYAFANNQVIIEVVVPNTIQTIGLYTFMGCSQLQKVTLPNGLTQIENSIFDGCENLIYNEYENGYYLGSTNNNHFVLMNIIDPTVTEFSVSNDTKIIINSAFNSLKSVTTLSMPLVNETLLELYGVRPSALETVHLTDGTILCQDFFNSCYSLKQVYLPASLVNCDFNAFSQTQIETIYFDGTIEDWCSLEFANIESNPFYCGAQVYYKNDTNEWVLFKDIVIPESVSKIGNYQFYGSPIESVCLSRSLQTIGEEAFDNCNNLQYNEFENGLYLGNEENPYLVFIKPKDKTVPCVMKIDTKIIYYRGTRTNFNVYYLGTEEDWSLVENNASLPNRVIYYYSEMEPISSGNYWHYVDGIATKW